MARKHEKTAILTQDIVFCVGGKTSGCAVKKRILLPFLPLIHHGDVNFNACDCFLNLTQAETLEKTKTIKKVMEK